HHSCSAWGWRFRELPRETPEETRICWPASRQSFIHLAAMHCIFNAVHDLNNGGSAGLLRTLVQPRCELDVPVSGLGIQQLHTADAVSARRTANMDAQKGAREFLSALDRRFSPSDDSACLEWTNALPQPGATARAYFNLLGAAWFGRSSGVRESTQGHLVVELAFRNIVSSCHDEAEAARCINCDEELQVVLIPSRREKAPHQAETLVPGAADGDKLRLRPAFNL
ncbi:MAG: hypothetical protein SGPRY_005968, partial [Prymnesium sp.]